MKNGLLFLLFLCPLVASGQANISDSLALKLVERHKIANASKMTMPGYRIQVFFGNERAKAQEIRTECMQNFPDLATYLLYQQPNFKVRLGDFKTRLEASATLQKINEYFRSAFIVPDDVKLPTF